MACFPGLAQAQESGELQYEPDVPTVPNNESSNDPSKKGSGGATDDGSDAEAGGSTAPGGGGSGGSDDSGTGNGAHQGQTNQGSGGDDGQVANGSKPAGGQLSEAKPIAVTPISAESDDGSSPLVPILIAIAVLAAISIAAFFYRQRRQEPGSPISPKAS
jgi:hypothetical protein